MSRAVFPFLYFSRSFRKKKKFVQLNKGKSHQVLFQEHFTVRMPLSKVAAAAAINFCALGKKKGNL